MHQPFPQYPPYPPHPMHSPGWPHPFDPLNCQYDFWHAEQERRREHAYLAEEARRAERRRLALQRERDERAREKLRLERELFRRRRAVLCDVVVSGSMATAMPRADPPP